MVNDFELNIWQEDNIVGIFALLYSCIPLPSIPPAYMGTLKNKKIRIPKTQVKHFLSRFWPLCFSIDWQKEVPNAQVPKMSGIHTTYFSTYTYLI